MGRKGHWHQQQQQCSQVHPHTDGGGVSQAASMSHLDLTSTQLCPYQREKDKPHIPHMGTRLDGNEMLCDWVDL
jgi:hypothetical protein